jgi:hypothetical protein
MSDTFDYLSLYDYITVSSNLFYSHYSWKLRDFKYDGIIKNIKYDYINRGAPHWGKEKNVYVGFIDRSAYYNLLLQGSPIMCAINGIIKNCYVKNIEKNEKIITKLEICLINDDPYKFREKIFEIEEKDIDSMLITNKVYNCIKI